MAKIGTLFADLGLNTARFESGINKANKRLNSFSRKMTKTFKKLAASAKKVVSTVAKIGLVAGTAAAAGIALLIRNSLIATDNIGKLSKTLGISVEQLAAFKLAAEINGSTLEVFTKTLKKVTVNVQDFIRGTGEAVDAFKALEIKEEDLIPIQNDHIKVMGFLADKFNLLEDGAVKTALAYDVFGGRNIELLTLLKEGSKGFEDYLKEAKLFGLALSTDAVEGVEAANDSITRLKALFKGLIDQTTAQLAPAIEMIVSKFRNWLLTIAETEGGIEQFARTIATKVLDSVEALGVSLIKVINFGKKAFAEFSGGSVRGLKNELEILSETAARTFMAIERHPGSKINKAREASLKRTIEQIKLVKQELRELSPSLINMEGFKETFKQLRESIGGGGGNGDSGNGPIIPGVIQPEVLTEALSKQIEAIQRSLFTGEERLLESRERQQIILDGALEREQISEERHRELTLKLDEKHEKDRGKIKNKGSSAILKFADAIRKGDLQGAAKHGAAATQQAATQNKALFKINKAFSLATAIAALPGAVMESFLRGGGYPWGLIPAGLMLATGLSNINAIRSATFSGGGATASAGGGGGSGGVPASLQAQGASDIVATVPAGPEEDEGFRGQININILGDPSDETIDTLIGRIEERFGDGVARFTRSVA